MSASFPASTSTASDLELVSDQNHLLARLIAGGVSSRPFPLPKVPSYFVEWLSAACERFWFQHQRCLGFHLLFSPSAARWLIDLPRQTCSAQNVRWDPSGQFRSPAGYLLFGSYQAHPAPEPVDLFPLVPSFSGIHFVHVINAGEPRVQLVLRVADPDGLRLLQVPPDQLIGNTPADLLESHRQRLQLI